MPDGSAAPKNGKASLALTIVPETPAQLAEIFRDTWLDVYDDLHLPDFDEWEMHQLQQILDLSPKDKSGLIIDHAIRHWKELKADVAQLPEKVTFAMFPSVTCILDCLGSATHLFENATKIAS